MPTEKLAIMQSRKRNVAHLLFFAGVVVKGIDGVLETVAGLALVFVNTSEIQRMVAFLTHDELIEDPDDFFANLFVRMARRLTGHTLHFAAIYLLAHGIIKAGLSIGMLRKILWSYPLALIFLMIFIGYQIYRVVQEHSTWLGLLTSMDVIIMLLIWREWRRLKNGRT